MIRALIRLREHVRRTGAPKRLLKQLLSRLPVMLRERVHRSTLPPYNEIEDAYHIIFIHIPKTAGKAVFASLFQSELESHQSLLNYRLYDRQKFSTYFKFAMVRDPWDRFASAFFYLKSNRPGLYHTPEDREFTEKYLAHFPTLEAFIRALDTDRILRRRVLNWTHFRPQHTYVCDSRGTNLLDYVGKFEEISLVFDTLKNQLGIRDACLIEKNKNRQGEDYVRYYDRDTAQIVGALYARDVKLFGYDDPFDIPRRMARPASPPAKDTP